MLNGFEKIKNWDAAANGRFIAALNDYFDEDKCALTAEAANELIKRGSHGDLISAENLLVYATQHFFDGVEDTDAKAAVYYTLGTLYETKLHDYVKAFTAFEKYSLNNTKFSGADGILLRVLLLRDGFTYSDELEKYLARSFAEPDLGLRNDRIYETIGNYLVAKNEGKDDLCEKYKKQINAIVKADEIFVLDIFMKKDNFRDVLELPDETKAFIKSL